MTEVERALLRAYERAAAGLVAASGRIRPDGPRKRLTEAQRREWRRLRLLAFERELAEAGRPKKARRGRAA